MIELRNDALVFSFPEVHPEATLSIDFQRTLRIPDDEQTYPLPPGLGKFPVRHVDDFADRVPSAWLDHGGVMLPMYQSEALWIYFDANHIDDRDAEYPFAIKIAAGKINAVSGQPWDAGLHGDQDYVVAPEQPWLDGFCVEKGMIRQFVAMPLGAGYSAEEQITGAAQHGGLQVVVYPMKAAVFERRFPQRSRRRSSRFMDACMCSPIRALSDMALAPGGKMKQEIYDDPFDLSDWDQAHGSRCFIHLANSLVWASITGHQPPTTPPTAAQYTRAGLPWFDYYAEHSTAMGGSSILSNLKSVLALGKAKGDVPLPENEPVNASYVIGLRRDLKPGQVREGRF